MNFRLKISSQGFDKLSLTYLASSSTILLEIIFTLALQNYVFRAFSEFPLRVNLSPICPDNVYLSCAICVKNPSSRNSSVLVSCECGNKHYRHDGLK